MAERLQEFEFGTHNKTKGKSRFDKWLDGGIYKLSVPADIPNTHNGVAMVRARARKRGLRIRSQVVDGHLIVQAYQPEDGA